MAINETLVTGRSAVTVPVETISGAIVRVTTPSGTVALQCRAPGATEWVTVWKGKGAVSLSTPDIAVEYSFELRGASTQATVYFGP